MERRRAADSDRSRNARTVESYEQVANDYARETAGAGVLSGGLNRLAETIPAGHLLEIGSGPGWDADALEKAGVTVRRTDITQAFIEFQRDRGRQVDQLDAINDDFGGPYDAVVALHVLQHVEPADLPAVLAKMVGALRPEAVYSRQCPWAKAQAGKSASPATPTIESSGPKRSSSSPWHESGSSRSGRNDPSRTRRAGGSACWLSCPVARQASRPCDALKGRSPVDPAREGPRPILTT